MPGTIFGFDADTVNAFDKAYTLAQKPEVQAVMLMSPGFVAGVNERAQAAYKLALQGFIIDAPIVAFGADSYMTMVQRQVDGYDWVASGLQANGGGKGPTPPGAITVSTNIADYPPNIPPAPAPSTPGVVGPFLGMTSDELSPPMLPAGKVYSSQAGAHYNEGDPSVAPDGKPVYYHMLGTSLMDPTHRVGVWIEQP